MLRGERCQGQGEEELQPSSGSAMAEQKLPQRRHQGILSLLCFMLQQPQVLTKSLHNHSFSKENNKCA